MAIQQYSVNQHPIQALLTWVESNEIAIPEIQRPFVWDATKVRDLMDSLYQGYPIGYLIAWRNPDVKLKDGSMSSGKRILIDGQQRVTALMAALLGRRIINKDGDYLLDKPNYFTYIMPARETKQGIQTMKSESPLDFHKIAEMTEHDARVYVELIRWPTGAACPRCGGCDPYKLKAKPDSKRPVRPGVYKCRECRKQFTVKIGTIFEDSPISLKKWLMAFSLICSSKKGISSHQLHRMLGVTYKTAWFMTHRIRHAMTDKSFDRKLTGTVEVDETYIGGKMRGGKRGRGSENKTPVVALVERDGSVRCQPMDMLTSNNLLAYIHKNVDRNATVMTDEFKSYIRVGKHYEHHVVKHSIGEYVRGNAHTNTVESFFSLIKRGVIGAFHHVSKQHLHRYLNEFNFRYNRRKCEDAERTIMAIKKAEGKRLFFYSPKNAIA